MNCDSVAEWNVNQAWLHHQKRDATSALLPAGIHPWKVNQVGFETMGLYLQQAPIVGEIGLDTVWTKIPLAQ